ncbi:hypothetical protein Peur_004575 [Populus x canadensis]
MAKNKRNTRRPPAHIQQLHDNSVLALAAPHVPPPPPPLLPSPPTPALPPAAVAGGSSPDKFLIFAEEGSVPQPFVPSPSTPDHVIVEDCSDADDYDDEEVDYSASGGSSKFFHSPVPPSAGNTIAVTPTSVLRDSPLCGSGHSVAAAAISPQKGPSPVPANISSPAVAVLNPSPVVSPPTAVSPSGPSTAPVEQWRDLFATNRNTITAANRGRSVFDRLGPVTEPPPPVKSKDQFGESSHNYDPMTTEAAVATDGWELVKSKKARKSPSIPVNASPAAAQVSTTPPRGQIAVGSSSGGTCPPVCTLPITNNGKEPVGAIPCRKDCHVIPVGVTPVRGQRRNSSRASGSGRVPPTPPPM